MRRHRHRWAAVVVIAALYGSICSAVPFIRGDANQDGNIDLADAVSCLTYLFGGGSSTCTLALDANDDGQLNIADPIMLLGYLFAGGAPPTSPFPDCGEVPDTGDLSCLFFNPDVCPPPPVLEITGISPSSGLRMGGYPVTITGKGFDTGVVRAYLCNRTMALTQVTATRIDATAPAGAAGEVCALRVVVGGIEAVLPAAFTYEELPPPDCLSEADMQELINTYVGQPLCLPAPAFETEIPLIGRVVACPPDRAGTCSDGSTGCEATISSITTQIDFDLRVITADFTANATIPVDAGSAKCAAQVQMAGSAEMDFELEDTVWPGVYLVTDVRNLAFTVDSLTINSTGGFVCPLLNTAAGELRGVLEDELNAQAAEFENAIREELVGSYVCP